MTCLHGVMFVGSCRGDGLVVAGWAMTRGRRSYNEDNVVCEFRKVDVDSKQKEITCVGIFDGHGGVSASDYVKEKLFDNILDHPNFGEDVFKSLSAFSSNV